MTLDAESCYRAIAARDERFDGVFFVAVTSTGIYCRPICTARTPRQDRCRYFASAAAAEGQGFRPCLKCRPELAPGFAPVDAGKRMAHVVANRIESGALDDEGSLERLAQEVGLGPRQIRRLLKSELGVSPVGLAQTRRLLLAKQLLTETDLSAADVAFASGFGSVRRFNDLFRRHYQLAPTQLRRSTPAPSEGATSLKLRLAYRPPYAWEEMLEFLAARTTRGVEVVEEGSYVRTVREGDCRGWLRVSPRERRPELVVDVSLSLVPVLAHVLSRVKSLFDLGARPDVIDEHLRSDHRLAESLRRSPGLRVPGAFDGFEIALRAILGQQISVRAATDLAGRVADRFGEPIETPFPTLTHLSPNAPRLAEATVAALAGLGMPGKRASSIRSLAAAVSEQRVALALAPRPEVVVEQLERLDGIGPWTAHYIAMRALRWPDAFPHADLGLRKALGGIGSRELLRESMAWRPWRAYAAMHLWRISQRQNEKGRN
ncbi:DNA-3-methyladenine glycosylase 2 [Planctomycetes bacterium Pan216]|uniref:DNA-3-methyladenine glycosylase II n=1 Tax=Kolteria novifilia TaxID=2527975 RepID=A0A518B1Y9_9BACT|nr:DNA-3-methyladenine glycosylase 2 [Planctomycetes bacterium Pan216]